MNKMPKHASSTSLSQLWICECVFFSSIIPWRHSGNYSSRRYGRRTHRIDVRYFLSAFLFFSFALTLSWHCLYYVFELLNFLFLFSLSTFLFGEHSGSYSCRLFSHFFANVHCTNENTPNIHKQKSIWALMESSSTADNFFSMANRCVHSAHEKHLYVCTRFVCHPLCRSCLCAFFSAPFCA